MSSYDLRLVADTSGAYIPGHGTPTVIIIGRNHSPVGPTVRAVLGVRGEPGRPDDPAKGMSGAQSPSTSIGRAGKTAGSSVADLDRKLLATHPWSLTGGGAIELLERIESVPARLSSRAKSVGITSFTLEDDVYIADESSFRTRRISEYLREMVLGDGIRDWSSDHQPLAIFPYDDDFQPIVVENFPVLLVWMWPYRTNMSNNLLFGSRTKIQGGLRWSEYGRLTASKLRVLPSIVFAFVATHNHFVLDRGGKVFNRSAPVIKLSEEATEDEHLALLGVLNSSTGCFWLKQNSHDKGNRGGERSTARYAWENFYEFTGSTLENFPLCQLLPTRSEPYPRQHSQRNWLRANLCQYVPRKFPRRLPSLTHDQSPSRSTPGWLQCRRSWTGKSISYMD